MEIAFKIKINFTYLQIEKVKKFNESKLQLLISRITKII